MILAHAFGQRYDLPLPLLGFVLGGAIVVFASFLLILPRPVTGEGDERPPDGVPTPRLVPLGAAVSLALLVFLGYAGITGSQAIPENILPTLFWVYVWVVVPLSCGVIGNWTGPVNPFAALAILADRPGLRRALLGGPALPWPDWLGWWPAAVAFFGAACGELIYNQTATLPRVLGTGLLCYGVLSAVMGLFFGSQPWLRRGEMFSVLFATWGRLGYFRFGAPGRRRFGGGLDVPFEATASRIMFVLLLLVSVSFDGLLSTPTWAHWQRRLPHSWDQQSTSRLLVSVLAFLVLAVVILTVFSTFAHAVAQAGRHETGIRVSLAGLLPSLLPISFGYLTAHYLNYILINGQLMIPLLGNPTGHHQWLPAPFNDSYEVHIHLLPSAFYWYAAVVVIIFVHVAAVLVAHRHLTLRSSALALARRAEWPWIVAMVCYTMVSLWLLAQPLTKEGGSTKSNQATRAAAVQPWRL